LVGDYLKRQLKNLEGIAVGSGLIDGYVIFYQYVYCNVDAIGVVLDKLVGLAQ
jgi:hypothetical protein